jgi:hypothetical protein
MWKTIRGVINNEVRTDKPKRRSQLVDPTTSFVHRLSTGGGRAEPATKKNGPGHEEDHG